MTTMTRVASIAVLVLLVGVGQADAAIEMFFGEDFVAGDRSEPRPNSDEARTAFLSDLLGAVTEDFEAFSRKAEAPLVLDFGPDTATISGRHLKIRKGGENGRFATSGNRYLDTKVTDLTGSLTVSFSSPQAAMGFYGIDMADCSDFQGQITLWLAGGGTRTLEIPHTPGAPNGSVFYYGLISTSDAETFTRLEFGDTSGTKHQDWWGMDDMTVGSLSQVASVNPEPASLVI